MKKIRERPLKVLELQKKHVLFVSSTLYYCPACGAQEVWAEVRSGATSFSPHGGHTGDYCCIKCNEFWRMDVMPDHDTALDALEIKAAFSR